MGQKEENYAISGADYNLLEFENGAPFTAIDRDNDKHGSLNLAEYYEGGWWFKASFRLCVNCKKHINGHNTKHRFYETYMAVRKVN